MAKGRESPLAAQERERSSTRVVYITVRTNRGEMREKQFGLVESHVLLVWPLLLLLPRLIQGSRRNERKHHSVEGKKVSYLMMKFS